MCIFLCFDTIRRKRILTDAVVIKCAYGLHSYGIFGHFVCSCRVSVVAALQIMRRMGSMRSLLHLSLVQTFFTPFS